MRTASAVVRAPSLHLSRSVYVATSVLLKPVYASISFCEKPAACRHKTMYSRMAGGLYSFAQLRVSPFLTASVTRSGNSFAPLSTCTMSFAIPGAEKMPSSTAWAPILCRRSTKTFSSAFSETMTTSVSGFANSRRYIWFSMWKPKKYRSANSTALPLADLTACSIPSKSSKAWMHSFGTQAPRCVLSVSQHKGSALPI